MIEWAMLNTGHVIALITIVTLIAVGIAWALTTDEYSIKYTAVDPAVDDYSVKMSEEFWSPHDVRENRDIEGYQSDRQPPPDYEVRHEGREIDPYR